ncbi:hypothetical protein EDF58_1144 [Novosphingobium sp. PhB57]|nr:hypothetical protein EDF58_1144 [Novosphingobium sp. PhB57]
MLNYYLDIDSHLAGESPALGATVAFMKGTKEKAEGFNIRRATVNELITSGANLFEIEKLADKLNDEAGRGYENAHKGLTAAITEKEAAVNARVALTPSAYAAEIRNVFRGMSPGDRTAKLAAAFKDGDKEVLAALVNAPVITHGCDSDQLAAHYEAYKRSAAYAEYRVLDEHKKAMRYLEASFPGIMKWKLDNYKGTGGYSKKLTEQTAVMASYGITLDDD